LPNFARKSIVPTLQGVAAGLSLLGQEDSELNPPAAALPTRLPPLQFIDPQPAPISRQLETLAHVQAVRILAAPLAFPNTDGANLSERRCIDRVCVAAPLQGDGPETHAQSRSEVLFSTASYKGLFDNRGFKVDSINTSRRDGRSWA
jgi:hypothetical protein